MQAYMDDQVKVPSTHGVHGPGYKGPVLTKAVSVCLNPGAEQHETTVKKWLRRP